MPHLLPPVVVPEKRRVEERGLEIEGGAGEGVSTTSRNGTGVWGSSLSLATVPAGSSADSLPLHPALSRTWWIDAALENRVGMETRSSVPSRGVPGEVPVLPP